MRILPVVRFLLFMLLIVTGSVVIESVLSHTRLVEILRSYSVLRLIAALIYGSVIFLLTWIVYKLYQRTKHKKSN